ncbi:MAG: hypothetical protein GQ548_05280 [Methylophaga sp.]|nr:hypothetical protein [Methylophaga sp.]
MRLELNGELLLFCSILFVLISWTLAKFIHSRKVVIAGSSFFGAFVMPAFAPGHGEIVALLPNAALFAIPNAFTWGLGFVYLIINFILCLILFNWAINKFHN